MYGHHQSQLGFAIYNRSIANRPLGEKLDFGSRGHPIDADKDATDDVPEFGELDIARLGFSADETDADESDEGYLFDEERLDREDVYVYHHSLADSYPETGSDDEKDAFFEKFARYICGLIGVSIHVWMPSRNLMQDAIRSNESDDDLREIARLALIDDAYTQSFAPAVEEGDDTIPLSQQSTRGGLPNIGRRHRNVSYWLAESDRRKGSPSQVGESNSRRQTCARRARREAMRKRSEHYFGFAGLGHGVDGFSDEYVNNLEALLVDQDHRERYEREVENWVRYSHPAFSSVALNEALEEMQNFRNFGFRFSDRDLSCDVAGLPGYRPEDSRSRIAERDAWLNEQRISAMKYRSSSSPLQHRQTPVFVDSDLAYFGQSSGKRSAYRRRVSPKELELSL